MDREAVLIAGGGTGGHIYPGLALAHELQRRRPGMRLLFIGNRGGLETRLVPAAGYPLRLVLGGGLTGKSWPVRLGHAAQIPLGLFQSGWHVMRAGARVVVGSGGYASGPAVLAARLLGRATLIMEQNALPGATNRILAPLVDQVAVAFAATAGRLNGNIQVTGNPVREDLLRPRPYHQPGQRLLIFGGSRGARGLNSAILGLLPGLAAVHRDLPIHHQTGPADLERVRAAYAQAGLKATVVPYIDDMADAYAAARLVICRAGATSVAELTAVGRPAILIPLPHSVAGHQEENAREMARSGAAILIREDQCTDGRLLTQVLNLLSDGEKRLRMEQAARQLGTPDAAARVADLVLKLHDRKLHRMAAGNGRPA